MENSDADSYLVIVKSHVTAEAPGEDRGFRRSSPLRGSPPFSGANAGSILRLRQGWSFECDSRSGVSTKTFSAHVELKMRHAVSKSGHFTHDMTFFHRDVRGKRFNTHGAMENSSVRVNELTETLLL